MEDEKKVRAFDDADHCAGNHLAQNTISIIIDFLIKIIAYDLICHFSVLPGPSSAHIIDILSHHVKDGLYSIKYLTNIQVIENVIGMAINLLL